MDQIKQQLLNVLGNNQKQPEKQELKIDLDYELLRASPPKNRKPKSKNTSLEVFDNEKLQSLNQQPNYQKQFLEATPEQQEDQYSKQQEISFQISSMTKETLEKSRTKEKKQRQFASFEIDRNQNGNIIENINSLHLRKSVMQQDSYTIKKQTKQISVQINQKKQEIQNIARVRILNQSIISQQQHMLNRLNQKITSHSQTRNKIELLNEMQALQKQVHLVNSKLEQAKQNTEKKQKENEQRPQDLLTCQIQEQIDYFQNQIHYKTSLIQEFRARKEQDLNQLRQKQSKLKKQVVKVENNSTRDNRKLRSLILKMKGFIKNNDNFEIKNRDYEEGIKTHFRQQLVNRINSQKAKKRIKTKSLHLF